MSTLCEVLCVSRGVIHLARTVVINRPSLNHHSPISLQLIMPTTRSAIPINRSGLHRGSPPSKKSKRKRSNADEHARTTSKRQKDEINVEEEGEQKMKGGRGGKKAKKGKALRFVPHHHIFSTVLTNFQENERRQSTRRGSGNRGH
jgi:hypothetical protein